MRLLLIMLISIQYGQMLHAYDQDASKELVRYLNSTMNRRYASFIPPEDLIPRGKDFMSTIKRLVLKGADPNAMSRSCAQPLHFAADVGDVEGINFLYEHGALFDINGQSIRPLFFAIRSGHVDAIKRLVDLSANIAFCADQLSPLAAAANYGQCKAVTVLINCGAQICPPTFFFHTPFYVAVHNEQKAVVIQFINYGVTIPERRLLETDAYRQKIKIPEGDTKRLLETYWFDGQVPATEGLLHKTVRLRFNEALEPILEYYAGKESLSMLINQLDVHGQTALDIAIATRNEVAVLKLLAYGADPLQGLFDGLLLASRLPQWRQSSSVKGDADDSIYHWVYEGTVKHYIDILVAVSPLFTALPSEVQRRIIGFVLEAH